MRNKVQLIGHLGQDPDVKEFEKGKRLARFSIATNEHYKNADGEKVKETQWHNVVAWNKSAEFVQKNLKKGSEIVVDGKLIHRNYNDKDGNKKYVSEVVAGEIMILSGKDQ